MDGDPFRNIFAQGTSRWPDLAGRDLDFRAHLEGLGGDDQALLAGWIRVTVVRAATRRSTG